LMWVLRRMAESDHMTKLVRGDFGEIARGPHVASVPASRERQRTADGARKARSVHDLELLRRDRDPTDGKDAPTPRGLREIVARITEAYLERTWTQRADFAGQPTIRQHNGRGADIGPRLHSLVDSLP